MKTKETILNEIFDLFHNENPEKAFILSLELLEKFPNDSDVLINIAGMYEVKNDIINAIEYYLKAVKINDKNDFANFKLGDNLYILKRINPSLFNEYVKKWQKITCNNIITDTYIKIINDENVEYNSEYLKLLFDNFADSFDRVLAKLNYATPQKIASQIEKIAKNQEKIIDFGCGTGLCGELVRKYASKLVGVDISQKMIDRAKIKSVYDELICSDLLNFTSEKKYDIGICGDVFTYFKDIDQLLKILKSTINKDGYLLISFSLINKFSFKNVITEESGRYLHNKKYLKKV